MPNLQDFLPEASSVSAAEAGALFADLIDAKALVLAVSGGPDSTALMVLAARWAKTLKRAPVLTAITVDHGLRKESKREALDVARLAKKLGLAHRTLRWTGEKPKTGLPQAARHARYRLLGEAARKAGALYVLTAHTRDDQAETVLIRLLRGSGLTGLAAMARTSELPGGKGISLVRPLLDIPKARLIATLNAEKIAFADDPTNRDVKFTRARLRGLMPQLAGEGLDAGRLSLLAQRLKRADLAIEAAVDAASALFYLSHGERSRAKRAGEGLGPIESHLPPHPNPLPTGEREFGNMSIDSAGFSSLAGEIALRLLGRAIAAVGDEGPVELAKLEALKSGLEIAKNTGKPFRRSLAGAVVTLTGDKNGGKIVVERAPARRVRTPKSRPKVLTKGRQPRAKPAKTR